MAIPNSIPDLSVPDRWTIVARWRSLLTALALLALVAGCESTYYSTMEKFGLEKRDLLVDRIEDSRDVQQQAQRQFRDALEQYRSVVQFDGGDLEAIYDRLRVEFEDSERLAVEIGDRIRRVEDVAEDLFEEWEEELSLIKNPDLRRDSAARLRETRAHGKRLIAAMWRAEQSVHPVLDTLRDQVYYLKHNLNARAVAALKGELRNIDADVNRLVAQMQDSINEADAFIRAMQQ